MTPSALKPRRNRSGSGSQPASASSSDKGAEWDTTHNGEQASERLAAATSAEQTPPDAAVRATRAWARELVGLGGPNTLLWRPANPHGTLDLTQAHPGGLAMLLAGRSTALGDLIRETGKLTEARRQARRIAAHTRETSEERGLETAFLVNGVATWRVSHADTEQPFAPVLLRRCALCSTPAGEDFLEVAPTTELNPALVAYISRELGTTVDGPALVATATGGQEVNPAAVWSALRELCRDLPGFALEPRILYSTYPRHKAAAAADVIGLVPTVRAHPLLSAAAGGACAARPDSPQAAVLPLVDPWELDGHAQAVLDALATGDDVSVIAPPGTGSARLIAAALTQTLGAGGKVLLVSEKRAVLEEVAGRLDSIGLGAALLHLTDPAAPVDPKTLNRWDDALPANPPDEAAIERANAAALALDAHAKAMHDSREPWGVSLHQAQQAIVALAASEHPPHSHARLTAAVLAQITPSTLADHVATACSLAERGAWRGGSSSNPWWRARLEDETDVRTAQVVVDRVLTPGLDNLERAFREVFNELDLPPAGTVADHGQLLATLAGVHQTLEVFKPDVFHQALDDLVDATAERNDSVAEIDEVRRPEEEYEVGRFEGWRLRRQARGLLRPGAAPDDLHQALVAARDQRDAWRALSGPDSIPQVPADLERATAAYEAVHGDLAWLSYVLAPTADAVDLTTLPREALVSRLSLLREGGDLAQVIPGVIPDLQRLDEAGWREAIEECAARDAAPSEVESELTFIWWASFVEQVGGADANYGSHGGDQLREFARTLSDLAPEISTAQVGRIGAALRQAYAQASEQAPASLQALSTPVLTWATALREHLGLLQAAAPCWAITPLSVGEVVPAYARFELVIVADAGHTSLARVASAVARGQQTLLVGDPQLLGPAGFSVTLGAEADREATPACSALQALSPFTTSHTLRHTLVRPAPLLADLTEQQYAAPLSYWPLAREVSGPTDQLVLVEGKGVLDERSGMVETTNSEVDQVIELIREHVHARPQESLAVVTFGEPHSRRVVAALSDALAADPDFYSALTALPQTVVIKPAHRFQHERRDHAIVTLGYGKTFQGRVIYRFGGISEADGAALIRLAATRGVRHTTWVSTLASEDLQDAKLNGPGPRQLKQTLMRLQELGTAPDPAINEASAADQPTSDAAALTPEPEAADALVRHLAGRLRAAGHGVRENLGSGAQRIDLAIVDPRDQERMLLAVTTDGPQYLSLGGAVQRDGVRHRELMAAGWHHLPLWSVDVFRDPAREEARVSNEVVRVLDSEDRA